MRGATSAARIRQLLHELDRTRVVWTDILQIRHVLLVAANVMDLRFQGGAERAKVVKSGWAVAANQGFSRNTAPRRVAPDHDTGMRVA